MTKKSRKNKARLGAFTHDGYEHRAWSRDGVVYFRRKHGRRVRSATLGELYSLVVGQRLLGL